MQKRIYFKGCLFDLDGTLVDSTSAVNRAWTMLAKRNQLNVEYVLSVIHGRPASESINELLSGKTQEHIDAEIVWLQNEETKDTDGVVPIDGAIDLLNMLDGFGIPWAIVTSGTIPVAEARLKASGIRQPDIFITAERITYGKPNPEPYLLGANELGLDIRDCIVFEDAPAGIKAGLAANSCATIGILSHAMPEDLLNVECIKNYRQIDIHQGSGCSILKIKAK